jgi:hypothetical protein
MTITRNKQVLAFGKLARQLEGTIVSPARSHDLIADRWLDGPVFS